MATLAKPYTVTDAAQQSEDIDRMLDELYRAVQDLDEEPASTGVAGLTGSVGPRGADGDEGEPGEPGQPGFIGASGPIGPSGPIGRDGEDGEDGATGLAGPAGAVGASGAPGRDGEDANDSIWPTPIYVQASTNLTDSSSLARLSAIQSFTAANTWTATGNNFDEILAVDKGLQFPATQVADSGANVLDDYEEGTWTPAISFGDLTTGITYEGSTGGLYIKVGRLVFITGKVNLTSKGSATGVARLTGLPFQIANTESARGGCPLAEYENFSSLVDGITAHFTLNDTVAVLYFGGATTVVAMADTNFANTSKFYFGAHYKSID